MKRNYINQCSFSSIAILLRLKANQAIFKCSVININQSACELGKWLEINCVLCWLCAVVALYFKCLMQLILLLIWSLRCFPLLPEDIKCSGERRNYKWSVNDENRTGSCRQEGFNASSGSESLLPTSASSGEAVLEHCTGFAKLITVSSLYNCNAVGVSRTRYSVCVVCIHLVTPAGLWRSLCDHCVAGSSTCGKAPRWECRIFSVHVPHHIMQSLRYQWRFVLSIWIQIKWTFLWLITSSFCHSECKTMFRKRSKFLKSLVICVDLLKWMYPVNKKVMKKFFFFCFNN